MLRRMIRMMFVCDAVHLNSCACYSTHAFSGLPVIG